MRGYATEVAALSQVKKEQNTEEEEEFFAKEELSCSKTEDCFVVRCAIGSFQSVDHAKLFSFFFSFFFSKVPLTHIRSGIDTTC